MTMIGDRTTHWYIRTYVGIFTPGVVAKLPGQQVQSTSTSANTSHGLLFTAVISRPADALSLSLSLCVCVHLKLETTYHIV